jgi:hypothetical protein
MGTPDANKWKEVADDFMEKWNFPHCVGAIDGKHVVMQAPANGGSQYFNYKGKHSILLLAVVDANLRFLVIDVGAFGRSSDGGVFSRSVFGKALQDGTLDLPSPSPITANGQNAPYVFVVDEAFPLRTNLMRP